jgi:hypothetical protein
VILEFGSGNTASAAATFYTRQILARLHIDKTVFLQ